MEGFEDTVKQKVAMQKNQEKGKQAKKCKEKLQEVRKWLPNESWRQTWFLCFRMLTRNRLVKWR